MAACLRCLQVDLRDKSIKMSCPFCAYMGMNNLSYLNHIIIAHYNASYGCGKCLKQAFVSSSALHNHKKVCLRFNKKSAAGSNSKPSSSSGGDGSQGGSSTRAAADATSPTTPSPTRTRSPKRTHRVTRRRRGMRAPLGRAPVTSCTNTAADVRSASPTAPLSHQRVPVSIVFLILVFSQINYFCCKTRVPVII